MSKIKLTSYGAAEQVTGSCHLLSIDGFNILIDCGLFQGASDNYQKNWQDFSFDPRDIDAVILTHAHLDHCGRLPVLLAQGYNGKIYTTTATAELAEIVLADNLHIMAEKSERSGLTPLYQEADLKKLASRWHDLDYYQSLELDHKVKITLHNAGHILGSAMAMVEADNKKILFTGDLGARHMPLVKDADYIKQADYVVLDSTYGDRQHEHTNTRDQRLLENVKKVTLKSSTLLIPLFAIERTQDILKVINDFYESHLDFRVPVYIDSPMAENATEIYKRHLDMLNQSAQEDMKHDRDIFSFPHLHISRTIDDSKKINSAPTPKIIITGSGMAEGGRVLHHLAQYCPDSKNHILFMGFQVPGTLGYTLTNGAFDFDYYGHKIKVKATIEKIDGFSAHADQEAILNWLLHFEKKPRKIFLVHGDKEAMEKLDQFIQKKIGTLCEASIVGKKYEL